MATRIPYRRVGSVLKHHGWPDLPINPAEVRADHLWPFDKTSFVNLPRGDGAAIGGSAHALAVALRARAGQFNFTTYTTPVNVALSTDPDLTVQEVAAGTWKPPLTTRTVKAPSTLTLGQDMTQATATYDSGGAISWAVSGSPAYPDGFFALIDRDAHTVTEAYKATWTSGGAATRTIICRSGTWKTWDLRGDAMTPQGARASRLGFLPLLIRKWELDVAATDPQTAIRHALALAVNNDQLLNPAADSAYPTPGYQHPARGYDSDGGSLYTGQIRMGTMFILDPAVDVTTLGLTAEGLALAYALRDYGAYVVDRANQVTLYGEVGIGTTQGNNLKSDWAATLLPLMRPVLNNSAADIGGPGARVRALAPDWDSA